ncbi:alpha/beta fold hydrolase [Gordonia terrae]|uniref:alpha/beta fold hydrolase n=1 Tax=Gordonia terrae TaxID=2055 RepID=UPI003F6D2CD4
MTTSVGNTGKLIDIGGANVFVHERGHGHALVLLHGAGPGATGMSNFSPNYEQLSKDFRVVVPDMPGWGASDSVAAAGDPVQTVVALLDTLGIATATLIGNSMGAMTALRTAAAHPDRVSSIVTMGATCPGPNVHSPGNGPTEGIRVLVEGYQDPSPQNIKRLVQIMCYDPAFATDALARERSAAALERPEHLNEFLTNHGPPGVREYATLSAKLTELLMPVLAIHGRDDRVVPFENSLRLVSMAPDSRLLLINRCGHWAQIEHADEFNSVVRQFVTASKT